MRSGEKKEIEREYVYMDRGREKGI